MPTVTRSRSGMLPFHLATADPVAPSGRLLNLAAPVIERMTGLSQLNGVYERAARGDKGRTFLLRVLDDLKVRWRVRDEDVARIPRTGPLLVVANHPFGAIEGIVLAAVLHQARPDTRVLGNYLLSRIPELRELFFFVDPFGNGTAQNLRPVRDAMRWVAGGGLLAMFPAGEVASLDVKTRTVTESHWNELAGRIARKSKVPVLPIFFGGHNGTLFQIGGLLHPRVRTALLPHEVLNKRGSVIDMTIGSLIPARKLNEFADAADATDYMRERTLLLGHRAPASTVPAPQSMKLHRPIISAERVQDLAADVASIPPNQKLLENGDFAVYQASAHQLPHLLREIGRLREITYRATGEGTGNAIDLDRFDRWYTHLFVWNKAANEVVGAYRLGAVDQIVPAQGIKGLYTSTLFNYGENLLDKLGGALELGRSFVRLEYQKNYAPLLLLWRGIGQFVAERPKYNMLFGPVSISNDYHTASKQLLVQFLAARHGAPELAGLTRSRRPFKTNAFAGKELLGDSDDIDTLVSELEADGKGIPVLVRQYIKLGARFFAYNVDPDFNNALDALMAVDLRHTEPKLLSRYMGPQGAREFLAFHGVHVPLRPSANTALAMS